MLNTTPLRLMQLFRKHQKELYQCYREHYDDKGLGALFSFYRYYRGCQQWLRDDSGKDVPYNHSYYANLKARGIVEALHVYTAIEILPEAFAKDLEAFEFSDPQNVWAGMWRQMSFKLIDQLKLGELPGQYELSYIYDSGPQYLHVTCTVRYSQKDSDIKIHVPENLPKTYKGLTEAFRVARNQLKKDLKKLLKSPEAWPDQHTIDSEVFKRVKQLGERLNQSMSLEDIQCIADHEDAFLNALLRRHRHRNQKK
jgi:hypothetical protein